MSECTLRRCISDCAHAFPALLCIRDVLEPSLNYALYQTRMVILNFDAWCNIMKNISLRIWATDMYCVITLLLSIGTVQGSTDICLFLVQIQLRYIYIYWTPSSAHTLEQRHLSTRLHSSHAPAEICSEWLLDLQTPISEVSRAIDTCSCSCGSDHRLASDHYMTSLKSKILFLSRCWVIDENVISLRWWPFWKWRSTGSPSQFGDGGIH